MNEPRNAITSPIGAKAAQKAIRYLRDRNWIGQILAEKGASNRVRLVMKVPTLTSDEQAQRAIRLALDSPPNLLVDIRTAEEAKRPRYAASQDAPHVHDWEAKRSGPSLTIHGKVGADTRSRKFAGVSRITKPPAATFATAFDARGDVICTLD